MRFVLLCKDGMNHSVMYRSATVTFVVVAGLSCGHVPAGGRVNDFSRIREHKIVLSLSAAEFERSMGRAPEDQGEFDA